jgi:hypothetical protein
MLLLQAKVSITLKRKRKKTIVPLIPAGVKETNFEVNAWKLR